MNQSETDRLIDGLLSIGIAFSKEQDRSRLLELILTQAMEIAKCDGGTLYIMEGDCLRFEVMVTTSQNVFQGGTHTPITLPPVPLSRNNVCAYAAISGELFNIPDVYNSDLFDFSGPRNYDAITGYRTKSMLVTPMEDDQGKVIGVLQLINALDREGNVIPFDPRYERIVLSLACQAAICLINMNYAQEVQTMLDSFVRALATAVDARSPYNANHTRSMAAYAARFLDWLDGTEDRLLFSSQRRREFLLSVWLHDIGKLVIPLEVMDKADRLGGRKYDVDYRFQLIELSDRLALAEGRISQVEYAGRAARLAEARELVERVNEVGWLEPEQRERVEVLGRSVWTSADGAAQPWLTQEEVECLCIQKGTLTAQERQIMQRHVEITTKILGEIQFPSRYAQVPLWAGGHHELLNGGGYPKGLKGEEIPLETRLLTILDVFEALTAEDRPYRKGGMSIERAFQVLYSMAEDGEVDRDLLRLFEQSRAWEPGLETEV